MMYQLFYKNTTFTVFVYFLKKQLTSHVLVRLLKKSNFTITHIKKQNLTHPKVAKLATLEFKLNPKSSDLPHCTVVI